MQPILILAIAAVAVAATSVGFLGGNIDVTVQDLGVGSATIESPISSAFIDLEVSVFPALGVDPNTGAVISIFKNVVSACSFHSNEDIPGQDIIIICKLTDWNHQVIAEGSIVLPNGYTGSTRHIIPICQDHEGDDACLAFEASNLVTNVDDVTIVVIGDNPTIQP